jgi:succinoglycan biosynthesis protein ExoO
MKPEVSVIIPVYNSEKYIAQALESVFNQSYSNLEVILIDDASQDSTVEISHSFHDPRLRIFENEQNRGVSYGRNFGIRQAQGKWIALLDSDDWYASDRLEKLIHLGEANDADLIADDLWLINEEQTRPWSTLLSECPNRETSEISSINAVKFVTSDRLGSINASRTWSFGYTKPIIKREFLLKHQIWYDETLKVGEDFSLYLECLRHQAKFYLVNRPYYYYRIRTTSLSTRKKTEYLAESCAITQSFMDREIHSPSCEDSSLHNALLENLQIFQKRLAFYHLKEYWQELKLFTVIDHLMANPSLSVDLIRKSRMGLEKKIKEVLSPVLDPSVRQAQVYNSSSELVPDSD